MCSGIGAACSAAGHARRSRNRRRPVKRSWRPVGQSRRGGSGRQLPLPRSSTGPPLLSKAPCGPPCAPVVGVSGASPSRWRIRHGRSILGLPGAEAEGARESGPACVHLPEGGRGGRLLVRRMGVLERDQSAGQDGVAGACARGGRRSGESAIEARQDARTLQRIPSTLLRGAGA
jgi:hypothetical protein